mgnify:CR=1 FL=1
MEKCSNCGREFEGRFCPDCGTPAYKTCPDCGKRLDNDTVFCPDCGYRFAIKNGTRFQNELTTVVGAAKVAADCPISPLPVEKVTRGECKWLKIKDSIFAYKVTLLVNKCFSAAAWGLLTAIVVFGFIMAIADMNSRYNSGQGILYFAIYSAIAGVLAIPQLLISKATSNSGKRESNEIINEASVLSGVYYIIYRTAGAVLAAIPSIVLIVTYVANYSSYEGGYFYISHDNSGELSILIIYMILYFFPIIGYFVLGRMRDVLSLKLSGDYDTVKREMEIGIREETERVEAYANYCEQMRRYKVDKKRVTNGLRQKTESEHNRDRTRITWFKRGSAIAAAVAVVAIAVGVISGIDPNYAAKAADIRLGDYEAQVIRIVGEDPHEKSGNTYHWYGKNARKIKNEIEKLNEKAFGSGASEKDVEQAMKKTDQLEEKLDKLGGYKHLSVTFVENELGVREAIEVKYDTKEQTNSMSDNKKIKSAKLSGSVDFKVATTENGETVYSPDKSSSAKQTVTAIVEYADGSYVCKKVYVSISDGEKRIAVWNICWLSDPIKTTYTVTSLSSRDGTMTISFGY